MSVASKTWRDCLACKESGKSPTRGTGATVNYDPGIQMPGTPTISGDRISAERVAGHSNPAGFRISAEREGFEPSVPFSTYDFQSYTFGHSVTAPRRWRGDLVGGHGGKLRTRRDLNPRCFRTSDFESDTIGHSDTCPKTTSRMSDRDAAPRRTAAAPWRIRQRERRRPLRSDD